MSDERGNADDLPFFDEDMPFDAEEQPPAEPIQNVANQRPPIYEEEDHFPAGVRRHGPSNRPRRAPTTPVPINYLTHYHDQNMRNVHGRLYSEPIPIRRPQRAQDAVMNVEPPNDEDTDYDDSNHSRGSLSPPMQKVAKRYNNHGKDDKGDDTKN